MTKESAIESVTNITSRCVFNGLVFLLCHRDNAIVVTAVKDCDAFKHFFPKAEIKQDSRKTRYAELIISYE